MSKLSNRPDHFSSNGLFAAFSLANCPQSSGLQNMEDYRVPGFHSNQKTDIKLGQPFSQLKSYYWRL